MKNFNTSSIDVTHYTNIFQRPVCDVTKSCMHSVKDPWKVLDRPVDSNVIVENFIEVPILQIKFKK